MEIFYIFFTVCFICFLFRTVFNVLYHKKSLVRSKKLFPVVSIAMFFLWFSWFPMSFWDPIRMELPLCVTYLGLALFIIGIIFVVLSHVKIKGFESKKFVRKGIYSKIRHPMYLGFMLWLIGFPTFTQSLFTLASSVIWIPQILLWEILEEKEMEKKYKDYKQYKKKTWF